MCTSFLLLHQLYLRSSGIRYRRLGTLHWRVLIKCIDALTSPWLIELESPRWQEEEESQESIILVISQITLMYSQLLEPLNSDSSYDCLHFWYRNFKLYTSQSLPYSDKGENKGKTSFQFTPKQLFFLSRVLTEYDFICVCLSFMDSTLSLQHYHIKERSFFGVWLILTGSNWNLKNIIWEKETSR